MTILTLSNEQVIELVKQLPVEQQVEVFKFLLLQQWQKWESPSHYGSDKVRLVAQERGYSWDAVSEDERLVVQKSRERLVYGESQCETGVTE
jgi:hypothetical protein